MLPPIGTSGIYKLGGPFGTLLQVNMAYRCEAQRRIADLVEAGIEPYEEFYQKYNLSREQYNLDLLNQVSVVSLVSEAGHWVFVPSSYILAYPDINGVAYRVMVLALEIGSIPNYRDLSGLKSVLQEVCRDTLGVVPQIKEVAISAEQKLSQADHETLEANRLSNVTNTQTYRARYLQTQQDFQILQARYLELQQYVLSLQP